MMYFVSFFCKGAPLTENNEKRERTRATLKNALIALCDEKSYYDITIWDICNKAEAYRSTFYRYFDTKDEMLREIEQKYLEKTRSLTPTIHRYHPDASPEEMARYLEELTADMEYHLKNEKLCRFLLSAAGDIWFYGKMKKSLISTGRKSLEKGRLPHWNMAAITSLSPPPSACPPCFVSSACPS